MNYLLQRKTLLFWLPSNKNSSSANEWKRNKIRWLVAVDVRLENILNVCNRGTVCKGSLYRHGTAYEYLLYFPKIINSASYMKSIKSNKKYVFFKSEFPFNVLTVMMTFTSKGLWRQRLKSIAKQQVYEREPYIYPNNW